MSEIKNSPELTALLQYSEDVTLKWDASISAERYVFSILSFMFGEIDLNSRFMFVDFNKRAVDAGVNLKNVKEQLFEYIESHSDYDNDRYIVLKLDEARELSNKKGESEVSPELLLDCILNDPTEMIGKVFEKMLPKKKEKVDIQALFSKSKLTFKKSEDVDKEKVKEEPSDKAEKNEKEEEEIVEPKLAVSKLTKKVKKTQESLLKSIYGQDNAVSIFTTGYFQAELLSLTDKERTRPSATFIFAGPPGVGKTFLAEKAAEVLKLPFMRFDMSEYSDSAANTSFCGTDKSYSNAKAGNVTKFVNDNPKCVLLFDEIEKAYSGIIHLFLQILDAGRVRDNYYNKEISFSNAIIIFTTNAGKQLYEGADTDDLSVFSRKTILNALRKDINPYTRAPYFPDAICSRFASGNVVMFNHISEESLREIARKEVLRHAENFSSQIGIDVNISEDVYTALLFAEGGNADARTIRSRAESFFDDELFELFRMIDTEKSSSDIADIDKINISIGLSDHNSEINELFNCNEEYKVMIVSDKETVELCSENAPDVEFVSGENDSEIDAVLRTEDVKAVLIDLSYGKKSDKPYLNIEDIESKGRDLFRYIRENYASLPVYLLEKEGLILNPEERLSYVRQGVHGFIEPITEESGFGKRIIDLCEKIYRRNSVMTLARSNKIVSFETAQYLSDGGKTANIVLFDFKLETAVDAEDSKSILSNVSKPDIPFEKVIGAEDAKKELKYFVEYLKNPRKYLGTGVKAPKGAILYGPPGTGKTMLAKAMAAESNATFIAAEGNQFLKKYVGEGPEKVHELFTTARKYAPAIIFVDEIDAIAKERSGEGYGSEATLTAFLTEMDGFKNDPSRPVFVLAATNFDVEPGKKKSLDPALMRRFDRRIYIDLPNRKERIEYIKMTVDNNPAFNISEDKIENIAVRSTGMSLAELESIFELSLRSVVRDGGFTVTDEIIDDAFENFNSGERKNYDIQQLKRVARHEAGHTFVCWKSGEKPSYVTIVSRGGYGGYMQHDDEEEKLVYTKDELISRIRTSLGGRAAELVYYGEEDGVSTGASGDLKSATNVAKRMICDYGMDKDFGLAVADADVNSGEFYNDVRTAINKVLDAEMEKAINLISDNKAAIDALVDALMEKNHLMGKEIDDILSKKVINN